VSRLVLAVLLAALAGAARGAESPRGGSFDIQAGPYLPDVDSEFAAKPGPWEKSFGTGRNWLFRGGVAWALYHGYGTVEAGVQAGYFNRTGKGQLADGTPSGDATKFQMIPTSATLTYRFDWLADRYGIPFAPYGRLALDRYNWWVTDGANKTTRRGATNGWSAGGGLALLLDFFDPGLAREMDRDSGINHAYLFAELRKTWVDDFGSSKSWILSDDHASWAFGLLFVY
jgi:hypothetical protein